MSHNMFSYNQEEAISAGVSNFITESNAYAGKVVSAQWIIAKTGTKGVEFTFESDEGLKANYLTIYYQKSNGESLSGSKMLNAIMGCTKTTNLTSVCVRNGNGDDEYFCPELKDKPVGFILQKTLYTKQNGEEGYKFEIRIPFIPQTGKTLAEQLSGKDAVAVNKILSTLTDKDERSGVQHQNYQQDDQMNNFVDDGWN